MFYDAYLLFVTVCNIHWGQVKLFSTHCVVFHFRNTSTVFLFTVHTSITSLQKKREKNKSYTKKLRQQFNLPSLESENNHLQSSILAGHCLERLGPLIRNSG